MRCTNVTSALGQLQGKRLSTIALLVCMAVVPTKVHAQTSIANANGAWSLPGNWIGGVAPAFTGLGANNITINSTLPNYIQVGAYGAPQNLTFSANNASRSITVNGTLVIYGNVDFGNDAMDLVISSTGVVIILGDLSMKNKIEMNNGGTLVVQGVFDKTGNQRSFVGTGGVYAGSYTEDAAGFIPSGSEFYIDPDLTGNPSLDYIESFLGYSGMIPLPVTLGDFKAVAKNGSIMLDWVTLTESNLDFFLVERSLNGIEFQSIAQLAAKGGSTKALYSFTDSNPFVGKNYYRLTAVDLDGSRESFDVISVMYEATKVVKVCPTPCLMGSFPSHSIFIRNHQYR